MASQDTDAQDKMDVEQTEKKVEEKEENLTVDGGVKKKILKKGQGWKTPEKGFEVQVHYVGKLLDGTVFDSSRNRDKLFTFKLGAGSVIKGWEEGIMSMKKGELALLTLSPDYAYGKSGSPPQIPPDATLQFEVELIDWTEEKDVSDAKDGGILKKIVTEGDGWEKPKDDSVVKINYKASLIDGTVFEEKKDFEFSIGAEQVIKGLDVGVASMKKNEKSILTSRDVYAYGAVGNAELNIPANAILRYEVELIEFSKEKDRWDMTKDEKMETAIKKKEEGNALFAQGKLARALKKYKTSLELYEYEGDIKGDEKEKVIKSVKLPCYLNIAACKIKTNEWNEVRENCNKALEIDPNNTKALFRRAMSFAAVDEWDPAKKDFVRALEIDPNNKDIKKEYAKLKQKIAEQNKKDQQIFGGIFEKMAKVTKKDTTEESTTQG